MVNIATNEQPPLITPKTLNTTYGVENPGSGVGQAQTCSGG